MPKENPVIAFLNKMADLILLNLIFLLCCIPVVTIGPAITALYAVSLRSVRYGDGYVIQTFFRSFKQNFKQSFVAGMIGLLFVCLLFIDLFFWRNVGSAFMSVFMTVVSVCVGYLVFIVFLWLFPVIAKLENPLRVQIKNAAAMAVAHFFPIYAVCKCDSTGGRLYGIYQYHYGCAAASDGICFTCICMFILFL